MVGKQKSDTPDDSRPDGLDLSESVGLFFSFLWFYRGVLLAILVLYGLYHVLTMAKNKVAQNKRRDADAPAFVYVPRPVENVAMPEGVSDERAVSLTTQQTPVVRRPEKKLVTPSLDAKTVRFQKFMATASVDSLFRRFKALMQEVPTKSPIEVVGNISKCQEICERLQENELTPDQQEMVLSMQLEAVSQLDAINVQHNMQLPGVRDQLVVTSSNLLQHPSVAVLAKAHLAIIAAHAIDLMFDPKREELDALINVYGIHVDGTIQGKNEPLVVADLLQKLVEKHQFDEVIALRRDLTNRMLSDGAMNLEKMNWFTRERIIFGDLSLGTLLSRIDGVSETATQDVNLFFERLERFPDARQEIFTLALAVVDRHLGNEQFDQASELLVVLQRIQPQIADVEIRDWLGDALVQYAEKMAEAQVPQ